MYLKKLRPQNIKCFEDVTPEFPHKNGDYSGWVVLLGESGAGKTTIFKAAAGLLAQCARPAQWVGALTNRGMGRWPRRWPK